MTNGGLSRRRFLTTTGGALALGGLVAPGRARAEEKASAAPDTTFKIGPIPGHAPQVGTLVSMLNYNRYTVLNAVKGLSMKELDHLHDPAANTIGALLLHLAAIDRYYQVNTFEGQEELSAGDKKIWGPAMELGDEGRSAIKGHELAYYVTKLTEVRATTLRELKKRDDRWLAIVDAKWSKPDKPLNNHWKWFHVCEHEANHRGQIAWLKGRLPGAKAGKD